MVNRVPAEAEARLAVSFPAWRAAEPTAVGEAEQAAGTAAMEVPAGTAVAPVVVRPTTRLAVAELTLNKARVMGAVSIGIGFTIPAITASAWRYIENSPTRHATNLDRLLN